MVNDTPTRTPLWRRWWMIVIYIFVGVPVVLGIIASAIGGDDSGVATTPSLPAPTRAPTPVPIDLATAKQSPLWIQLSRGDYFLTAMANPGFDVDEFDLNVFIDGVEYCNTSRIYGDDGPTELSCAAEERAHTSVQRVSAQTSMGDLRCAKNDQSTPRVSVFACAWR